MNTRRTNPHSAPENETLQALVEQALTDLQTPAPFIEDTDETPSIHNAQDLFFSAVQTPWLKQPSTLSLIEEWAGNASNLNWYEQVQTLLNQLGNCASDAVQTEVRNLQTSLESLTGRLVPAPAHRGASAARMVYPSQRRNIPAADLPTFHPLFCTAAYPAESPVRLAGLSLDSSYQCRFRSTTDSTWNREVSLNASATGGFKLDLSAALTDAPAGSDVIWMIEENTTGSSNPAWISGLVWRAAQIDDLANHEIEDASETMDWPWRRIKTLMEINSLYSSEMYVEAYETARCSLRAERAAPNDGSTVPFAEALWLMIEKCLDSMISRLEAAQSVFQTLKPEWDAMQQLRRLRQDINRPI
ncbi:MAG: hypothetical protein P9L94_08640 [Candidatus Hinthialibacter antarcticus]|nr:hypothetical protein [Candidatus Hinthialibacter antarcticus]